MAHMDVVPVAKEIFNKWKHEPFGGIIENNIVWGRGAKDMKSQLIFIFEGTEYMLNENEEVDFDIYFSLGFDEEVGGRNGAKYVADYLKEKT